jgi:TetR/AcrR family transcriptional repressor of lmrAB and yxaGH operons
LALEAIKLSSQFIQTRIQNALAEYSDPIEAIQNNIKCIIENLEDGNTQNISIGLLALETHLTSEPLRQACKEAFYAFKNIYAEKLITSGLSKEVAQDLSAMILAMIEGAVTVSVTQKNYTDLIVVSKQIGIILNGYFRDEK